MAKIKFPTKYDRGEVKRHISPTGEREEYRHEEYIDLDGRRSIVLSKEPTPIYDLIQASREQCEIERIVRRATMGDYSALNAIEGVYADVTDAPSSLAQAQQIMLNAQKEFAKLPKDIREKFENNYEIFIATAGSDEWCDKMGIKAELERQEAKRSADAEFQADMAKAMKNLASGAGEAITQTGIEGVQ